MLNLNFLTPNTASYEPSCIKISPVVFPVENGKKKKGREEKGRHKKSRKRYISPIHGEAPPKRIFTKFCTSGDMLDVIICANFGVEKLRGLKKRGVKFWSFPLKWLVTLVTVLRYSAACDLYIAMLVLHRSYYIMQNCSKWYFLIILSR